MASSNYVAALAAAKRLTRDELAELADELSALVQTNRMMSETDASHVRAAAFGRDAGGRFTLTTSARADRPVAGRPTAFGGSK